MSYKEFFNMHIPMWGAFLMCLIFGIGCWLLAYTLGLITAHDYYVLQEYYPHVDKVVTMFGR